jgi:chromosome segregation ATPase
MKCPKCGFSQEDSFEECLKCGLVFSKFEAMQRKMEVTQSRYSPGAEGDTPNPENEPALPVDGTEAPEPPDEAPALQRKMLETIEKIQIGMHSAMTFQEALAEDLSRQRDTTQKLFGIIDKFRDETDQRILSLQAEIHPLNTATQSLREKMENREHFEQMQAEFDALRDQIREFYAEDGAVAAMEKRLNKLEEVQREIRSALKRPAGDNGNSAPQEIVLIKTELQALRSEMRNLMDQTMGTAEEASAPPPGAKELKELQKKIESSIRKLEKDVNDAAESVSPLASEIQALDWKFQQMENDLQSLKQEDASPDERKKLQDAIRKLETKMEELGKQADLVGEFENRTMALSEDVKRLEELEKQIAATQGDIRDLAEHSAEWQNLAGEIGHLRSAFDLLAEEMRAQLDGQQAATREQAAEIAKLQGNITEIEKLFKKIRSALG